MNRRQPANPVSGNYSYSKRGILERRFDVDDPGPIKPNPFDVARDAYWAMPDAQAAVLSFWIEYALIPSPVRVESFDTTHGGTYESDLLNAFGPDGTFTPTPEQFRGGLLTQEIYPSWNSVLNPLGRWRMPVAYSGIPSEKDGEFAALIAEL